MTNLSRASKPFLNDNQYHDEINIETVTYLMFPDDYFIKKPSEEYTDDVDIIQSM